MVEKKCKCWKLCIYSHICDIFIILLLMNKSFHNLKLKNNIERNMRKYVMKIFILCMLKNSAYMRKRCNA